MGGCHQEGAIDRKARHIITGNLLQSSAAYKGKLVSYTTIDGAVKKGMDHWTPERMYSKS